MGLKGIRKLAWTIVTGWALIALVACNLGASLSPRETETPTAEAATATPSRDELLPLPSPKLAYRTPETGEPQEIDAPIELIFDQPMDQKSVTKAFTIEPKVQGDFTWMDAQTLLFDPRKSLARDASYTITIGEDARNAAGTPLLEPILFDFQTVSSLAVSEVQPVPGSEEIEADAVVTVVFNRPVVPLSSIGEQAGLPAPLTFEPAVEGVGEWLNTSIYRFHPREGFLPSTSYSVRIAAGLTDTQGSALPEDYTWSFSTVRPMILAWEPRSDELHIDPGSPITVTFNQPMDHASTEQAFQLSVQGEPVRGTFRWSGAETQAASEALVFTPAAPLARNASYVVRIQGSARAQAGPATLAAAMQWRFSTVRDPGVISTDPTNGQTDVKPSEDVSIGFASPMQRATLMEHLSIIPEPTRVYSYWGTAGTELLLSFSMEPATAYRITIDAEAPDLYGARLGTALDLRFVTGDLPPSASLQTTGEIGTFDAYTDTVIFVSHRNVSRLDLELYRVSLEQFVRLYGDEGYRYRMEFEPSTTDRLREWSVRLDAPRNLTQLRKISLTDATGEQLPPGIYLLRVDSPELRELYPDSEPTTYMFIRSRINLLLKQAETQAMVWATDLSTGTPVRALPVRFYTADLGWHGAGTTDTRGISVASDLPPTSLWDSAFAVSGEPGSASFALTYNDWDRGIRPWNYDLSAEYDRSDYQGYLYTDRPIYRPAQIVYFKGIVRADDDAAYSVPAGIPEVTIYISDPQGKELLNTQIPVSDMGTFYSEIALGAEAPLGTYYIEVSAWEQAFFASASFRVAEYRKPEFQISVVTDKSDYLNKEPIQVTADASYYFGGPVADADVTWAVLSSDTTFSYACPPGESCPDYSWSDQEWDVWERDSSYGRAIASGEARTDAQGRVSFTVPADISEKLSSQRFTIEVNVTDINDQVVSGRTTTIVHKALVYAGLVARDRIAKAGETASVEILTVDWDSQPTPGTALQVVFMEQRWYNVLQQAEDGREYWTWTEVGIPVYTTTVTTDGEGRAAASFAPDNSGSYRVRALGRDRQGNEIRSSTYLWVWGGGEAWWRRESTSRIDLVADRTGYEVGDVAEILIASPYSGTVQALVTIERGHLIETDVRTLQSNSEILQIPITADHIPNIFVSVVLVQGSAQSADGLATFRMGQVMLPVSTEQKALKITLTPDRSMDNGEYYRPQETAVYDVLVTDYAGRAVETELSLRLADLAVLALADDPGPTLLERFWSQRGLGVRTSAALAVAMEPYNRELAPQAKGGGGGAEDEGYIRTDFADTAYWSPVIRTDPNGRARVEVKLPDNLTTWRMQARGITLDTLVGQVDVDILSTLDLLVRSVLPRFFVVGDQAEIATIVHNATAETLTADVTLSVEGLSVAGETRATVEVPAEGSVRVAWPVTVEESDSVTVRMEARAGALFDGREDRLPVYRYATPEVVGTAGRLSSPELRLELVQLPPTFDATQGELSVQVDGSLTAATQDALSYLEHYPYECVEQTVSRFLPNVLSYAALKEMGIARPELRVELETQVSLALQRLYNQQHFDGGWGWWTTDESDAYLTAYALQGLLEAQRAGFTVDSYAMSRAVDFLFESLPIIDQNSSRWQANRLAYELYVLGEYRTLTRTEAAGELGFAVSLFEHRDDLDQYGKALLVMALRLLEPETELRVKTLISDLVGDAVMSAAGTHWEEQSPDYRNMNTDIRTTAMVLWALARTQPQSELLPNAVRWLMTMRKEGFWESTNTTSWSLMALIAYMRASGELEGDFSYAVWLNGQMLLEGDVNPATIDESRSAVASIEELLVDRANRLVIERLPVSGAQSGRGQLYYSAYLRYYLPVEEVKALDRGIVVSRQYAPVADPTSYVNGAQVGDTIRVKLTIVAPTDLYYVVVEDPLPAGCEAVDQSLKTTSVVGESPTLTKLSAEEESAWYRSYGWGWWWFSHTEMRDEKVSLFATYLPRGTYEYTYLMRASVPGSYHVIPTTAYEMYFPDVFGRSDGGQFVVTGE